MLARRQLPAVAAGYRLQVPPAAMTCLVAVLGAVAEGVGDDGRGGLEHELAERCGAGLGDGDAEGTELLQERAGSEGLPGTAAGEQPAVMASDYPSGQLFRLTLRIHRGSTGDRGWSVTGSDVAWLAWGNERRRRLT
jgi:hypothetical protein